MKIKAIDQEFTVCKLEDFSQVDFSSDYFFIVSSERENSLVCQTECVPNNCTVRDDGWKAFRIEGTLDFSLIGILAKISTLLAEHQIGIFAVSSYDTDYILTKKENFEAALQVLGKNGYFIQQ